MDATATLSDYRQAPRKVRLLADLVKGKPVDLALLELHHRSKRAAPIFEKLIRSALANAKALGMNEKTLVVKDIRVDKGPVLKRSRPRAHGRAFPIHKHTSRLFVLLSDGVDVSAKGDKGVKTAPSKVQEKKAPKPVAKKPRTKAGK